MTHRIRSQENFSARNRVRFLVTVSAVLTALATLAPPAHAQVVAYTFTKVADSARDDFDPNSFTCASINNPGDIAFKAGRTSSDGLNSFDGIYRANADGSITTIVEDPRRKRFGFVGNFPSMNDLGQVSFAANLARDDQAILRGDGKKLITIATTAKEFNFFGFDTSVNNSGEVAFKAELDPEFDFDEGLFSGSGGKITTHNLSSTDVSLDGDQVRFGGNDSRPSINNVGDIAFDESIQPNFDPGIFVGREGVFRTIAAPAPDGSRSFQEPTLNDGGIAASETSFFDEVTGEFVTAIVTGDGGPLTTVADTTGPFGFFGFRPPSINNGGEVAFLAILDDFQTTGIFVGPDATQDRVIATGDVLDGATVSNLNFCEEGLNDSGELTFIATLDELDGSGFRTAVFRATPEP